MLAKWVGIEYLHAEWGPRVDRRWGWIGAIVWPCLEMSIHIRLAGPAGCDLAEWCRQGVVR